jgi:hypothetical protein
MNSASQEVFSRASTSADDNMKCTCVHTLFQGGGTRVRMSGWLSASVLARNFHVPTLIRAWQQRRFCERLTLSPHTRPPPPQTSPHVHPSLHVHISSTCWVHPTPHPPPEWWVARAIYSKSSNQKQPVPVTDTLTAPTHSHHTHQLFPYLYTRPRMRWVHSTPCQRKRGDQQSLIKNVAQTDPFTPTPQPDLEQTALTPTRPICWSLHVLGLPPSFPSPAPTAGPANDQ